MRRFLAGLSLSSVALWSGTALAQDGDLFAKLDANKDGAVTLAEVPADQQARFEKLLKIAGKEADKKLSLPLFQAAMKRLEVEERAATRAQEQAVPAIDADGLFAKLDANRDGKIAADEVPEAQRSLFDRLVRNSDANGDKQLSKAEFEAGLKPADEPKQPLAGGGIPGRRGGAPQGVDPRQQFQRLDANKDGKLSKDELPERMQQNFARLDANSDGSISAEELARGGMAMLQRPGAPGTPNPQNPAPGTPGTPPPPQQLAAIFDQLDANKDGKLTKNEVPEERPFMRQVAERDASGVTKDEFVRAMTAGAPPGGTPMVAGGNRPGLLAVMDTNRDGELSKEEIDGAAKALLALDKNGDGKLSREEIGGPGPGGLPNSGRPGGGQPNLQAIRDRWLEADTNKDGKLSKDEAPGFLKERFDQLDGNQDGFLDNTEMQLLGRRLGGGDGNARPMPRRPNAQPQDGQPANRRPRNQ